MADHFETLLKHGHILVIDEIDSDLLDLYRWCPRKDGKTYYARTNLYKDGKRTGIDIHRFIMSRVLGRSLTKKDIVDHINRCGLDNRRSNLRLATKSQNLINGGNYINNSSGCRGVSWDKRANKWGVKIRRDGKLINLGFFSDIADARICYNDAVNKYFGEFAPQDGE